ncbi:histidine phosphatase family protein [Halalkalibacter urbisdiaboli]|uniref:histidine phosphatase family protein n=1 Tax=Halalkalibacter urbisdiaboli TaxID=1960589 RepID=UPI0013FDF3EC|nr:histidine phosphatase family protein [Halalkalibacter urbisdiaboli]
MEIYFLRHAQGEHVSRPPASLQIKDPSLTDIGKWQATNLKEIFPVSSDDLFIISPLRRTIQTALIWTSDVPCQRVVHPLVGPRMFPLLTQDKAYGCDQTLSKEDIEQEFPQLKMADVEAIHWKRGINTISEDEFTDLAKQFIDWCRNFNKDKIYIVSHDGTITSYRQYLDESVTREHFLGDARWHKVVI